MGTHLLAHICFSNMAIVNSSNKGSLRKLPQELHKRYHFSTHSLTFVILLGGFVHYHPRECVVLPYGFAVHLHRCDDACVRVYLVFSSMSLWRKARFFHFEQLGGSRSH